jgi:hypothetical protein
MIPGSSQNTQLMIYETAVPVPYARHGTGPLEVGTNYAFCRNIKLVRSGLGGPVGRDRSVAKSAPSRLRRYESRGTGNLAQPTSNQAQFDLTESPSRRNQVSIQPGERLLRLCAA